VITVAQDKLTGMVKLWLGSFCVYIYIQSEDYKSGITHFLQAYIGRRDAAIDDIIAVHTPEVSKNSSPISTSTADKRLYRVRMRAGECY
jgi:hypothetical protein